jgi:prophage DNA circulation protein
MSDTIGGTLPNAAAFARQAIGTARTIDNSGLSWAGSAWWQQLQPGSWRGLPFVLDAGETKAGRRVAVHEYPYRDTVWPEDVGKLPRRFAFQAFIVGDDVYAQRDALVAAAERPGPGTLVHPTMGTVSVVLLDFAASDRREHGRVVELSFAFVLAGDVQFPAALIATGAAVLDRVKGLATATGVDLASVLSGVRVLAQEAQSVTGFAAMAVAAVNDPRRALGAVAGMAGYFGRFAGGSLSTLLPATATVASVIADAAHGRANVIASTQRVLAAASRL